jgi:hypothetical protein
MTSLTIIPEEKELKTVTFHREHVMFRPKETDLLTLEDSDEQKLPAINKLLNCIFGFRKEMATVNIHPRKAGEESYYNGMYLLNDREYENFDPFVIRIECDTFDKKWTWALHAGFSFFLYVKQDAYQGRSEIADWIKIRIKHLETVPSAFASTREHIRALVPFVARESCYFQDIPMENDSTVNFGRMADAFSFKTALFNQSVEDACLVMKKIAARKELLIQQ